MPSFLSKLFFIFCCTVIFSSLTHACYAQQKDSVIFSHDSTIVLEKKKDSTVKKRIYSPRSAAIRSAVVPGLGQIYNKKYWKLPLVYGALGITGYIFFDNLKVYRDLKFAYAVKYKLSQTPNIVPYPAPDSTDYFKINPDYLPYSLNSIKQNRDSFRRNIDYSVLVFILFWGLNVVDATVDAHLKGFDVSPDLTFKIKPYIPSTNTLGLSFVLAVKNKHSKK